MRIQLGIDFGTTHTVVAVVDRGNYPIVNFVTGCGDCTDRYPSLAAYRDQLTYQHLVALLALAFEPYDPITTAPRVLAGGDPLLGVGAKQLLLYEAIGDSLVTNLATEMYARTLNIGLSGPSLR